MTKPKKSTNPKKSNIAEITIDQPKAAKTAPTASASPPSAMPVGRPKTRAEAKKIAEIERKRREDKAARDARIAAEDALIEERMKVKRAKVRKILFALENPLLIMTPLGKPLGDCNSDELIALGKYYTELAELKARLHRASALSPWTSHPRFWGCTAPLA